MNSNHHFRFLITIVFLVFVSLILILIYSKFFSSPIITGTPMTAVSVTPKKTEKATFGQVMLKNSLGTTRQPITDLVKLEILADSNGADVVGYDLILNFDTQAFKVVGVESAQADFSLFKTEKENSLIITGTKKLNANQKTSLTNQKIIVLTLKPQKTGKFSFEILSSLGKEKTQLVDSLSKIYYPKVNQIEIAIY
jgi:hypothetical protein